MHESPDVDLCRAISQPGSPVTVHVHDRAFPAIPKPGREFVCTQDDPAHEGSHSACDEIGHVLARWPRRADEQYWQPADCAAHDHA